MLFATINCDVKKKLNIEHQNISKETNFKFRGKNDIFEFVVRGYIVVAIYCGYICSRSSIVILVMRITIKFIRSL